MIRPEFSITLADSVKLDVCVRKRDEQTVFYDIYTGDKLHGSVYPVISDATGIAWLTNDNIDKVLLYLIGRAIESYEE